jgi:hypothetical protein
MGATRSEALPFFLSFSEETFSQGVFMQIVTATQMSELAEQAAAPAVKCSQRLDELFKEGFEGLGIELFTHKQDDYNPRTHVSCSIYDNAGIERFDLYDLTIKESQEILDEARTRFLREEYRVSEKTQGNFQYIEIRKTKAPVNDFIDSFNGEGEIPKSLSIPFDYEWHKYMSKIQEAAKHGEHELKNQYIDQRNPYTGEIQRLLEKLGFQVELRKINDSDFMPWFDIKW